MIQLMVLLRRIRKYLIWFDVLYGVDFSKDEVASVKREYLKDELDQIVEGIDFLRKKVEAAISDSSGKNKPIQKEI